MQIKISATIVYVRELVMTCVVIEWKCVLCVGIQKKAVAEVWLVSGQIKNKVTGRLRILCWTGMCDRGALKHGVSFNSPWVKAAPELSQALLPTMWYCSVTSNYCVCSSSKAWACVNRLLWRACVNRLLWRVLRPVLLVSDVSALYGQVFWLIKSNRWIRAADDWCQLFVSFIVSLSKTERTSTRVSSLLLCCCQEFYSLQ